MNTDKIYAEAVANEYSIKTTSKVVALRKLDRKVKKTPLILAIIWGVVATLILGVGMCLAMGTIGSGGTAMMVVGSLIGILGIVGASVNYPVYKKFLAGRKEKYAGDIILLAKEISDAE